MLLHRSKGKDGNIDSGPLGPMTMGPDAGSQQHHANPMPFRSSPLKFFSSSAIPTAEKPEDPQKVWTAEFLADLRSNRPARPSGSRPLPNRYGTTTPTSGIEPQNRTSSAMSRPICSTNQPGLDEVISPKRSASETIEQRASSALSKRSDSRLSAQQPLADIAIRDFTASTMGPGPPPAATYFERGDRWMEKQEARSLRIALENMDLQEEQRIHAAAQDEASDLVWEHRNPGAAYRSPDTPYDYRAHLRKGSHARSQSTGRYGGTATTRATNDHQTHRSVSDDSNSNESHSSDCNDSRITSCSSNHSKSNGDKSQEIQIKDGIVEDDPPTTTFMDLAFPVPPTKPVTRRSSSGSRLRNVSDEGVKGIFRNPDDQIYEEPEETVKPVETGQESGVKPVPLGLQDRNPAIKPRGTRDMSKSSSSRPVGVVKKLSSYEIHKNPPSQSRNPAYLQNALPPTPPDSANASDSDTRVGRSSSKNGVEIRSDDIRAATSMRIKDRSPKLPTPTMVSNRPGRPIVSFDRDYKLREKTLKQEQSSPGNISDRDGSTKVFPTLPSKPPMPPSAASLPVIPTINILPSPTTEFSVKPSTPTISVSDVPAISVSTMDTSAVSTTGSAVSSRPLPNPANRPKAPSKHRPTPHHSSTAPVSSVKPHWTPSTRGTTAQCAACALPISGRIVSAASQRFHPACFSCFQCGELLECVAFYPEPDKFRSERLARINARLNDEQVLENEETHHTEEEDGDDSLRFFCHLDFHEKYSPRCRSCKTPIEGEVVVACGGEWHVGHFFCAECGDPFSPSMPFVEKDGYAWCVDCHCKRFSGKCAGCRRPIVNTVLKALGREWHEGCFCCKVYAPSYLIGHGRRKNRLTDDMYRSVVVLLRMEDSLLGVRARIRCVSSVRKGD